MKDKQDFAFEKKIAICELVDIIDNRRIIFDAIQRLFYCMKETNDFHKVNSEYFRLDFRPQTLHEELIRAFPIGMAVLDFTWGSKKELDELNAKEGE